MARGRRQANHRLPRASDWGASRDFQEAPWGEQARVHVRLSGKHPRDSRREADPAPVVAGRCGPHRRRPPHLIPSYVTHGTFH